VVTLELVKQKAEHDGRTFLAENAKYRISFEAIADFMIIEIIIH